MKRRAVLLTAIFLMMACGIATAQRADFSINGTGVFANTVTGKGLTETATKSGGALLSLRFYSEGHAGVEINYGITEDSQEWKYSSSRYGHVQTHVYDLDGAYVYRFTHGKFQPFLLAGGGFLMFRPTQYAKDNINPDVSGQTRPAFLYGAGLDYRVRKAISVRAQYRGFVYEAPDLFGQNYAVHTNAVMQLREPAIGVVFHF